MDSQSEQALDNIRRTYTDLERWRIRSRQPEQPQQDSPLHIDARIWPHHPPYEVARQSLIAATQHLNLARTAIEAEDIYPTSHFTVLRGGLVGAAQAFWLLAPDPTERQQRALRVIDEMYRHFINHSQEMEGDHLQPLDRANLSSQLKHLEERRGEARTRWAATDTLTVVQSLNLTQVISWAARVFTAPEQQRSVNLLWKQMSGDAHALGWPLLTRPTTMLKRDTDGLGNYTAGGDLPSVAEAFIPIHRLTKQGWDRYDDLAEHR